MATVECVTTTAEATVALGEALGRALPGATLVLLCGALGSGKTTLAQGIARGTGVTERVQSPTFVLAREYATERGPRLVHLDFYRLEGAAEALDIGLSDYLAGDDIVLVEWPERAAGAFPSGALTIRLAHEGEARRIRLEGGEQLAECLAAVAQVACCSSR